MENVLIIGGNCDIGKYLVNYFLNKDCNVFVGYHNKIDGCNDKVKYIKCDVTNEDSIDNIINTVVNICGNIDIMINLSCICIDNSFLNKTKNELMKELEVNLVGSFLCNQIYSRYIDNGLIINMGSTDGINTYNEYSIGYSISKAGIINMTKGISLSTSNKILCICPNWIDTSSTRSMNREYLDSELVRIGQNRLITLDEFVCGFDEIINSKFNSGDIYIMDVKDDKLWVEKM